MAQAALAHPEPVLDWPTIYPTLSEGERLEFLSSLTPAELNGLYYDQPSQILPLHLGHVLMVCGRGFGKSTRVARTLRHVIRNNLYRHIGIVSPSERHFRRELLPEIIKAFPPEEAPRFDGYLGQLIFDYYNGLVVTVYSGANHAGLKGPNKDLLIFDELAHYVHPDKTFSDGDFALRVGTAPRWIVSTTPNNQKPDVIHMLQRLRRMNGVQFITGTTADNPFLPAHRVEEMKENAVEGSAQYIEQFLGQIAETAPGALLSLDVIHQHRVRDVDGIVMDRSIMAIDPAKEHGALNDETGIVVVSASGTHAYVRRDYSGRLNPIQVGEAIRDAYTNFQITAIVVETNVGGKWLSALLEIQCADLPIRVIKRKAQEVGPKFARAEPVAALYHQGRVHHVGYLNDLELQWANFTGEASKKGEDIRLHDDRVDACAYAVRELLIKKRRRKGVYV